MKVCARAWICAVALLAFSVSLAATAAQHRERQVTSVDLQVPWAPMPVAIGGRPHLAYELHITNFRTFEVALSRIEVRDPARGRAMADLRGSQLASAIGHPAMVNDPADARTIGAGMRAVVYFWLPIDSASSVPSALQHRVELDLLRSTGTESTAVDSEPLPVRKASPIVLDPPLRGGPWVALYAPAMAGGHRTSIYTISGRARIPARFAIDWVRLEHDATRARGEVKPIANWHGYGAEVLAVADATVVAALDDIAEAPALSDEHVPIALENASGNYVALDLGGGRYAFYEHLKHGSVRVKAGERVRRGQVIGQLGNSGSSSAGPHLHFHIADSASELGSEGLPYVFRSFDVVGAFPEIGAFATGEKWGAPGAELGGPRRMEMPAPNTVVMFR